MMTRDEVKHAFRDAISEDYERELAKYQNETPDFSEEFLDKMNRLIKKEKNPLWHMVNTHSKRILLVFSCCVIIMLSLNTIPKVRAYTLDFLESIFATHIELERSQEKTISEMKEYMITDLPTDYRLSSHSQNHGVIIQEYTNKDSNIIILIQSPTSSAASIAYDLESGVETEIDIGDYTAQLYTNKDYYSLSWCTEDATLKLSCYGGLTEEEFISIGLSVKPAE